MKRIAVLGLTGSIGLSVVEVVRKHRDMFHIAFASSHNNYGLMYPLADELKIDKIAFTGERTGIKNSDKRDNIYFGRKEVLNILASEEFDIVINAIAGSAGLIYSHEIMINDQTLALANKESLVMAGHLFSEMIGEKKVIPVDSEHSALFQLFSGLHVREVRQIILTASGGAFRELPSDKFSSVTPEEALQHPTWSMGSKITIDSATMFNKGLEIIEAHWLFGLPYDKISAVIHPQSVIHSLIECSDGSILSQLSNPSMQLPILYALSYPHHIESDLVKTSLTDLPPLTFSAIDPHRYPLYYLSRSAGEQGGIMPTVLNAANEAAVKLFLERKISFPDINRIVEDSLNRTENIEHPDLDTVLQINDSVFNKVVSSR